MIHHLNDQNEIMMGINQGIAIISNIWLTHTLTYLYSGVTKLLQFNHVPRFHQMKTKMDTLHHPPWFRNMYVPGMEERTQLKKLCNYLRLWKS